MDKTTFCVKLPPFLSRFSFRSDLSLPPAISRSGSRRNRCALIVGAGEPLVNYARQIVNELRANLVRVEADFSSNKSSAGFKTPELAKIHTTLVMGNRDMEAGNVSVRVHDKGNLGE